MNALDAATGKIIGQVISARDQCVANVSLITIAANLGFLDPKKVDITGVAAPMIDGLDFSSFTSGLDLTSAASGASPTSQLSTLTSLDLSGISTTQLNTLQSTTLPDLKTQLNSLKSALTFTVTAAMLTFIPSNPSASVQNQAVTDLVSRIGAVTDLINTLAAANGKIDTLTTNVGSIKTSITALKTAASSITSSANAITPLYDNAISGLTTFGNQAKQNVKYT
jgi:hypothetical protein